MVSSPRYACWGDAAVEPTEAAWTVRCRARGPGPGWTSEKATSPNDTANRDDERRPGASPAPLAGGARGGDLGSARAAGAARPARIDVGRGRWRARRRRRVRVAGAARLRPTNA